MSSAAPPKNRRTGAELAPLINEFTNPRKLPPENGAPATTLPSLWDLLITDTARTGGTDGSTQRSRPPVSTAVLSLTHDVRRTLESRLRLAGQPTITRTRTIPDEHRPLIATRTDSTLVEIWRDIPAELRTINQLTNGRDEQAEWADRVATWIHQAKAALGLLPTRIQLPRGTRCMDCGKAWVVGVEDGEEVRRPAVHLIWHDTGRLHYVACHACGSSRWPHDLHALANAQQRLNTQYETLDAATDADWPANPAPTPDDRDTTTQREAHMDEHTAERVPSPSHRTRVPKAR